MQRNASPLNYPRSYFVLQNLHFPSSLFDVRYKNIGHS